MGIKMLRLEGPNGEYTYYPGVTNENDGTRGRVDMGTLIWTKHSTHGIWVRNIDKADGLTNLLMIGTGYSVTDVSSIGSMADKTYKGHSTASSVYIRDDNAYDNMTEAEFKSAMSGKYLYYQRTTDTEWNPPFFAFLIGGNS